MDARIHLRPHHPNSSKTYSIINTTFDLSQIAVVAWYHTNKNCDSLSYLLVWPLLGFGYHIFQKNTSRRLLVERPWVMNLNSSTYCSSLNRTRSSFLKMLHRSILNTASYLILSSIYYWAYTHLSAYDLCFKTFLFLTGPFFRQK